MSLPKRRGNGSRRRGRRQRPERDAHPLLAINRSPFFAPARQRTHLTFDLSFSAPLATLLAPWSVGAIVMTNPNIFTTIATAVPGYTAWSGLYRKYRVRSGRFTYRCVNAETFPIEMFVCPVNFLPSTSANPDEFFSMQNCRRKLISGKGGIDLGVVSSTASPAQFGGSASTAVEDNYVGQTDNIIPPDDNVYFAYGFRTNGAASVAGALNSVTITVEIDFFELQSPSN